ncbi:acyltransferase family protein [Acuticoccus sp.]|uniref:acyltransferase family protein n=1 Tax=Acuticoccus sp. TaxID=1904378 RepID=UPI003B530463
MRQRIDWFDFARGASIVIVVALHASIELAKYDLVPERYWFFHDLTEFKMALFFAISGCFSARLAEKAWLEVVATRLYPFAVVLLLWSVIMLTYATVMPFMKQPDPQAWLVFPFIPVMHLWFVWVWLVFIIVARMTPLSARPHVMAAAILASSLAYLGFVETGVLAYDNALRFLPFFLAGAFYRDALFALTQRAPVRLALVAVPVFIGAVWLKRHADVELVANAGTTLQAVSGVALAFAIAPTASKIAGLGQALTAVGRRTLPLYLSHWIFAAIFAAAFATLPAHPALVWLAVPTVTLAAILCSFALLGAVSMTGADWIFRPKWPGHWSPSLLVARPFGLVDVRLWPLASPAQGR